jgi:hypothetical protein
MSTKAPHPLMWCVRDEMPLDYRCGRAPFGAGIGLTCRGLIRFQRSDGIAPEVPIFIGFSTSRALINRKLGGHDRRSNKVKTTYGPSLSVAPNNGTASTDCAGAPASGFHRRAGENEPAASGSQTFRGAVRCARNSAREVFELSCWERELHFAPPTFGGVNANPEKLIDCLFPN